MMIVASGSACLISRFKHRTYPGPQDRRQQAIVPEPRFGVLPAAAPNWTSHKIRDQIHAGIRCDDCGGYVMSINRIKHLRDCGVFRDFTWPGDLPALGPYNLIYGWNGSGKTTLSRLFRALEARTAPPNGQVTVTVDDRDLSNGDFGQVTLPIRVFNRDFMAESVFPTGGDVAPIFVLGKKNVEKQKQVEQLKATLTEEQTKLGGNRLKKTEAESALDRFGIDKAKAIKDMLRSPGSNPYNNYDKGDFRRRSEEMIAADDRQAHELRNDAREKLLTQLHATPKPELKPLTYQLPDLRALHTTVTNLLSTTVVSEAIQSLKDDADLSSWMYRGLGLHQERQAATCLFCDQRMPKNRLAALEAHFSTEYEEFLRKLGDQIATIQAAIETATGLSLPSAAEFYEDLTSEYDRAATALFEVAHFEGPGARGFSRATDSGTMESGTRLMSVAEEGASRWVFCRMRCLGSSGAWVRRNSSHRCWSW